MSARGSAGGGGLTTLTGAALADEIMKRRASYQRSLSRAKEIGDELFEASVQHFIRDAHVIRGGGPLVVEMYAATVSDGEGGHDVRGVYPTWRQAKERLESEKPGLLTWHEYGPGFATATLSGLTYETEMVKVYGNE